MSSNKPKVIILYNRIFHYRIPVWNILAEKCDLTVTYSEGTFDGSIECNFEVKYLPAWTIGNRFLIHKDNIRRLVKQYDVIIAYGNISWIKFSTLPWFSKNKVIFHSLGVSASYEKGYDTVTKWDTIRAFFYKKATAMAFYTQYPIKKYEELGIPAKQMFEAPNTVAVAPVREEVTKDSILFIGTLYKQKGIQILLDAYKELRGKYNLPVLNIVGKGPDGDSIKAWIEDNNMSDIIKMCGAIYDIDEKAKYFARALACVSPKQAGLTVLESMGYGVPFITEKNAITGGEIFNIHNGTDGVLMDDANDLADVIKDISHSPQKYIEMGKAAKDYYDNNRTPKHMADGLWSAILYALNQ